MSRRIGRGKPAGLGDRVRRRWWMALPALLGLYWLLPVAGQVLLLPGESPPTLLALPDGAAGHVVVLPGERSAPTWPQMRVSPPAPAPGQIATLWVTDVVPWAHMRLTVNGRPARYEPPPRPPAEGEPVPRWTWEWTFGMPQDGQVELVLYHDCHLGCAERGRLVLDAAGPDPDGVDAAPTAVPALRPSKLGLVFPHPARDWHGRSGWAVELAYAREPDAPYWGIDDLAGRVWAHRAKGLRVLVRVDYDRRQSFPPADNQIALQEYLDFARRLAADARLAGVHGYFYGSGFNADDANGLAGALPVTPEWYARVFNGAGLASDADDNLIEQVRAVNAEARLLVGPVRPFVADRSGSDAWVIDVPWLSYFNTLISRIDAGAAAKATRGRPGRPDGFALHVPGQPEALSRLGLDRPAGQAPGIDWRVDGTGAVLGLGPEAGGARGGFGVQADWLSVINAFDQTRGLPAYITAANTFAPSAGTTPAEGYPAGWLDEAYRVVQGIPQIQALCWFVDGIPGDTQWGAFQLTEPRGRSIDAANALDRLLREE